MSNRIINTFNVNIKIHVHLVVVVAYIVCAHCEIAHSLCVAGRIVSYRHLSEQWAKVCVVRLSICGDIGQFLILENMCTHNI